MKPLINTHFVGQYSQPNARRRLHATLSGGVLLISGLSWAIADDAGLPVSEHGGQAGQTLPDITSPALHPGIDVGNASASYSADGHKLTVNQTSNQLILDWNSFNIAAGNTVQFVQPGPAAVALNDIHQLDASQILGHLSANGQLYLINNDGFVFGKNSAVDSNSLVVSSLNISDTTFKQGIATVVNNGAPTASGPSANTTTPVAALTADGTVYRNTPGGLEKFGYWWKKARTSAWPTAGGLSWPPRKWKITANSAPRTAR